MAVATLIGAASASATPAFRAWIEGLWPDAQTAGVSRATFDRALRTIELDLSLPDLVREGATRPAGPGQAEFIKPPQAYLDRRMLSGLAEQGRALATAQRASLEAIERELGVDRHVVLAIWGRETAFGTYRPSHHAIRVLATQAFTGRRKEMFRAELIFALKLVEDRIVALERMPASWAGAMGLTQFMPSEFYSAGYDLDRDGRVDLFGSVPDALGSAARQLQGKGWRAGVRWGYEVRLAKGIDCALEGPDNARPIADWTALGVAPASGEFAAADRNETAYLMSPGGGNGPKFLVTENFQVIRRYNMSDLYAVFVGHLADRIAGAADFATPWGAITQAATRDIEEIQTRLQAAGYPMSKIDGKIGSNTRQQIGLYQRARKLPVDCWPSTRVLEALRGAGPG